MPRGPAPFRQKDLQRALKGARTAGFAIVKVEIEPTGKIVLVTGGDDKVGVSPKPDEWDEPE